MARAGFEVPDFLFVHQDDAEAFARTDRFNDAAEKLNAFAGRFHARQKNFGDVVFGYAGGFVIGVDFERIVARKDRFRTGEAHARLVEARGAVHLGLPVRDRGVAHAVLGKRIFKIVGAMVVRRAVHAFHAFRRRMDHEVLSLERRAVGSAGDQDRAVGGGAGTHHDGGAGERGAAGKSSSGCEGGELEMTHGNSPQRWLWRLPFS